MNIHYLSRSTLISDSANSVHVMKMCDSLSHLGHTVTLHAYKGEDNKGDIHAYYDTKYNFPITLHDEQINGLSAALWKARQKLPFLKVGGLPSFLYAWVSLRPHLQKADLVYSRNIYWLNAIPKGISFIFESHSPPTNILQKQMEKHLFQRKECKKVVVISTKMKEIYEKMFPHLKGKFLVAHDGADDPEPDDMHTRLDRPLKNIGYVGQLYKGRGIEIILQCASYLPDHIFHIVGGQQETIKNYRDTLMIPDNVIFHGHQPHASLPDFYKKFDAVLAPYQQKVSVAGNAGDTSAFMSPLKIFEYMSWGLPILCSDMPVLREVLEHEKNALLLPPENIEKWVDAIRRITGEIDLKQKLSIQAREDFLSQYTWRNRAKYILSQSDF